MWVIIKFFTICILSLSPRISNFPHFKSFNDSFGHVAGDAVLHEIGVFLLRNTRADVIACRYGGEEFVLIMPNADAEGTRIRIEQIRLGVKELRIMHGDKHWAQSQFRRA